MPLACCLLLSALSLVVTVSSTSGGPGCLHPETRADILLLIDGSGTVTPSEFGQALGLLRGLAKSLRPRPHGVRLGMLQVGERPRLELPLGLGTSAERVLGALDKLRQDGGQANTEQALAYVARPQAWGRTESDEWGRPEAIRPRTRGRNEGKTRTTRPKAWSRPERGGMPRGTRLRAWGGGRPGGSKPEGRGRQRWSRPKVSARLEGRGRCRGIRPEAWGRPEAGSGADNWVRPEAGSWPEAGRILLWLTDGFSARGLKQAAQALREAGVLVLAVSTGSRIGGLKEVVTPPAQQHLLLSEAEGLPGLVPQVCQRLAGLLMPPTLMASTVTAHGIALTWPQLTLWADEEHELTYGPVCEPSLERWTTLSWDARGHRLTGLRPDTDYWFRLRVRGRESRELRASARTLPADPNSPPFALVPLSSHRLGLEWSPGEPEGGRFSIVYGPLSGGPIRALQVEGRRETIFLDDLRPQTQYLITVSAARSTGQRRSYTLHGATLPDGRNTTSVAHTASPPSAPITNGSVRSSLLPLLPGTPCDLPQCNPPTSVPLKSGPLEPDVGSAVTHSPSVGSTVTHSPDVWSINTHSTVGPDVWSVDTFSHPIPDVVSTPRPPLTPDVGYTLTHSPDIGPTSTHSGLAPDVRSMDTYPSLIPDVGSLPRPPPTPDVEYTMSHSARSTITHSTDVGSINAHSRLAPDVWSSGIYPIPDVGSTPRSPTPDVGYTVFHSPDVGSTPTHYPAVRSTDALSGLAPDVKSTDTYPIPGVGSIPRSPPTPDVESTVVYSPDVGSTVAHTPDVGLTVVHSPGVRSTMAHSPDIRLTVPHSPDVGSTVPHSPDVGSTVAHTPDVGLTVVHSPDVGSTVPYSPDVGSTVAHTPGIGLTVVHSPDVRSTMAHSPDVRLTVPHSADVGLTVPHSPDVGSTVAHIPDVGLTVVHSPDVGSTVVHSPDVRSTVAHSPDVGSIVAHSPDVRSTVAHSPDVESVYTHSRLPPDVRSTQTYPSPIPDVELTLRSPPSTTLIDVGSVDTHSRPAPGVRLTDAHQSPIPDVVSTPRLPPTPDVESTMAHSPGVGLLRALPTPAVQFTENCSPDVASMATHSPDIWPTDTHSVLAPDVQSTVTYPRLILGVESRPRPPLTPDDGLTVTHRPDISLSETHSTDVKSINSHSRLAPDVRPTDISPRPIPDVVSVRAPPSSDVGSAVTHSLGVEYTVTQSPDVVLAETLSPDVGSMTTYPIPDVGPILRPPRTPDVAPTAINSTDAGSIGNHSAAIRSIDTHLRLAPDVQTTETHPSPTPDVGSMIGTLPTPGVRSKSRSPMLPRPTTTPDASATLWPLTRILVPSTGALRLRAGSETTLVASWTRPAGAVVGYLLRRSGVGRQGAASRISLPERILSVTFRHLSPGSIQVVCLRTLYIRGAGPPACARARLPGGTFYKVVWCPNSL